MLGMFLVYSRTEVGFARTPAIAMGGRRDARPFRDFAGRRVAAVIG
jgi:hypothetical protein